MTFSLRMRILKSLLRLKYQLVIIKRMIGASMKTRWRIRLKKKAKET